MGLRFRRTVRLFPGVKLNFSRSGVSTTIGVRGAGITLGPHGAYANVGLPGTGLSYRTRFLPEHQTESPHLSPDGESLPPQLRPDIASRPEPVATDGAEQIHSGAVSAMTSTGLADLKHLINEAAIQRAVLTRAVEEKTQTVGQRERRLAFSQYFIVRLFTQKAIPRLKIDLAEARFALEESRAALQGCHIQIDFGLDDASSGTFAALCRSFSALSVSQRIWDITETAKTDRIKERTTATNRVSRTQVNFDTAQVDIIESDYKSLRLKNASNFEIHLFPGFVLTKGIGSDFALLEWKDLRVEYEQSRFIETDPVPTDSEVVGHTWAKANKDGSPDRRFSDNYQIPIAKYGELWLRSPTGLYEAYMVSNAHSAEDFSAAIANHCNALSQISQSPQELLPEEAAPVESADKEGYAEEEASEPPQLIFDWVALVLAAFLLTAGGFWIYNNGGELVAKFRSSGPVTADVASPPLVKPALPQFYVAPAALNVRAQPSASARILRKLNKGARVSVFQVQGRWSQIGDQSPVGWALSTLLSSDDPVRTIDAR